MAIEPNQEFLVQPVDASWLQCNIECQEACPVGTNCRGYLNLAAEGRFEEGYILSRDPNPVAANLFEFRMANQQTGTLTLTDAANAVGLTPLDLTLEAQAWAAAQP